MASALAITNGETLNPAVSIQTASSSAPNKMKAAAAVVALSDAVQKRAKAKGAAESKGTALVVAAPAVASNSMQDSKETAIVPYSSAEIASESVFANTDNMEPAKTGPVGEPMLASTKEGNTPSDRNSKRQKGREVSTKPLIDAGSTAKNMPKNKAEAYAQLQESIKKILEDLRKNPELKKKLNEAASALKLKQKEQQDTQKTFNEVEAEYTKLKDNPKTDADTLKEVETKYNLALSQLKKVNDEIIKCQSIHERLLGATETTKQLRIREHKEAATVLKMVESKVKALIGQQHKLNGQMDQLLVSTKSNDKELETLENRIEEVEGNLDKLEETLEKAKTEVVLKKLKAETVLGRRMRERDRTKERLEALRTRTGGKKSKKDAAIQDVKDEIKELEEDLIEKEKEVQKAQKRKDAEELDIAAVGFDPKDPQDAALLAIELTTPEERAAAKKAFHKLLKDYTAAKAARSQAEKDLLNMETKYIEIKSQKQPKEDEIAFISKQLKITELKLMRAIRAEANAKQAYEIALRVTETLKETCLRVLREIEALIQSLNKYYAAAQKANKTAKAALAKAQAVKPVDAKVVELAKEKLVFTQKRINRIAKEKKLAQKALKIAQKNAAMYQIAGEEEWDEETPLVYLDEEDEGLQAQQEEEDSHVKPIALIEESEEGVTDVPGQNPSVNEDSADTGGLSEVGGEPRVLSVGTVDPSGVESSGDMGGGSQGAVFEGPNESIVSGGNGTNDTTEDLSSTDPALSGGGDVAPTGATDMGGGSSSSDLSSGPEQDTLVARPRAPGEEGEGRNDLIASGRPREPEQNEDPGADVLVPEVSQSDNNPPPPVDEGDPNSLEAMAALAGAEDTEDPSLDEGLTDEAAEDEMEDLRYDDSLDTDDTAPAGDALAVGGQTIEAEHAERQEVSNLHAQVEAASAELAEAQESGSKEKIVNAEIVKEQAEAKWAKAAAKQSPYGKEISAKAANGWENNFGKDLFDVEAMDKGGVFNAKPATSENVSDIIMEKSKLNETSFEVDRPRVIAIRRPGSSASVVEKLNHDVQAAFTDTGLGSLG